jgi:Ca-activated chloride channel family protein
MDEETLRKIASATGGEYFRATDEERLTAIYEEINLLERSEITVKEFFEYRELFVWFLLPAVIFMLTDRVLADIVFKRKN